MRTWPAAGEEIRLSSPSEDTATEEQPVEEQPAEPVDELRAGLLAAFETELGDAVVGSHLRAGDDLWVRVTAAAWRPAAEFAREKLDCRYFNFLSAIDWLPSPWGRYEVAAIDTGLGPAPTDLAPTGQGYAGGETRFQVFGPRQLGARPARRDPKADVPDDTLAVDSWTPLFAGAELARARDVGDVRDRLRRPPRPSPHLPADRVRGLSRCRKDFPLLARVVKPWPGIVDVEPMPGEEPTEGDETEAAE